MSRRLALVLSLLTAVTAFGVRPAHAAVTAAGEKVVFRWKIPASGHVGGWSASKGVLTYAGGGSGRVGPSFNVSKMTDFAIQAQMRMTGSSPLFMGLTGFGLMVRQKSSDPSTSVQAGSFFSDTDENTNPNILWDNRTIGGGAFAPGSAWHTYRVEVHRGQFTLLIDGTEMVSATLPSNIAPVRVGLFSLFEQVQARNFTVSRLASTAIQPALDWSVMINNLSLGDLPPTGFYHQYLQHWYTAQEVAVDRGVSEDAVKATGSLSSYGIEFFARSRDVDDIYSSITSYSTGAQARQDLAVRMAALRQVVPPHTDYQDLRGLNLGDVSDGYRVEVSTQGISFRLVVIYVARGRYTFFLRTLFDTAISTDPAKSVTFTADLARIIDQRLTGA